MIRKARTIALTVTALLALCGHAPAIDVEYVGAITAGLGSPTALVAGTDHIAALEPFSDRITFYTADGRITRRIDIAGAATGLAQLDQSLYLFCDRATRSIKAIDITGGEVYSYLPDGNTLADPVDLIVDKASVYVLDAGRREIVVIGTGPIVRDRIVLTEADGTKPESPLSFAYDRTGEAFYVFDQITSRILKYSRTGEFIGTFGSFGGSDGAITRGGDIVCDAEGYVYVSDRYQGHVVVFDPDGAFVANIDPTDLGKRRLMVPTGLAVDTEGLLYVASTEGRSIHIYYIERTGTPGRALSARPVYPENLDTVATKDLRLLAGIDGSFLETGITGIDFQLLVGGDTTARVDEAAAVAPDWNTGGPTGATAVWDITAPLNAGTRYGWRVRARTADASGEWSEVRWFVTAARFDFRLEQNYPNPFNAGTTILFELQSDGEATLAIYNLMGQQVWEKTFENLPRGRHQTVWDGTDQAGREIASGVYFYRLAAGTFVQTRKMVLLK